MKFLNLTQLFVLLLTTLLPLGKAAALPDNSVRPNFLIIVSDDQRYGTVGQYMPNVQSQIFDQGRVFDRAYITTAACCPSRSSMYTGLYATGHGVHLNGMKLSDSKPTFIQALSRNGYFTGVVGKYLTSAKGIPRPEFNYWISFRYGSVAYFDPILNVNGVSGKYKGYITDLVRDGAIDFLRQAEAQDRPFMLLFAPNAPHAPSVPENSTLGFFQEAEWEKPKTFNDGPRKDNPKWVRNRKRLTPAYQRHIENFSKNQLRTLWSLDRAIADVVGQLRDSNLLDNTVIIYISDNGLMWGEHGLISKECAFEPAVHVPMAIRYPGLVSTPSITQALVANIDIAPTIYEMAGIPSTPAMHGKSLVPLLSENSLQSPIGGWRDSILLEGFRNDTAREPFRALHTGRYKYVLNASGDTQLYDLETDPLEQHNLSGKRAVSSLEKELSKKLSTEMKQIGSHLKATKKKAVLAKPSKPVKRTARSNWSHVREEEDAVLVLPRAQERWLRHKLAKR